MGATQDLQQKVCQKFGWSLIYSKIDGDLWQAEIIVGLGNDKRIFSTTESFTEDKEGKAAVSVIALEGLSSMIEAKESLPARELLQVFEETVSNLLILDSTQPDSWAQFWIDPPSVVGIDVEGNQISPPVLVQISTVSFTILEAPRECLSADLKRLLQDDSITKVFCDNFAHKDKKSLGLEVSKESPQNYRMPPVVDLESLAMESLGSVKVARGLSRLVTLVMPELSVRIEKPRKAKGQMKSRFANVSRFAMIEQGKAKPLKGISDLSRREQRYAALDAWCTLLVYIKMYEAKELCD